MSFLGEAHKVTGGLRNAIESIAQSGIKSPDGTLRGTKKILGYVCAINVEGEYSGTVEVQAVYNIPWAYQVN